jgi:hypothetical protein
LVWLYIHGNLRIELLDMRTESVRALRKDNLRVSLRIMGRIYIDQNNFTLAEDTLSAAEFEVTDTSKHFVAGPTNVSTIASARKNQGSVIR